MLGWSATETTQPVDITAIVDDTRDPGIARGRELIALGRAATTARPDRRWLDTIDAAAVARTSRS